MRTCESLSVFLSHEIWLRHQGTECRFKWEDIQDWLKIRSQGDESEKTKKTRKLNQRSLKSIIEEKLGGSFRFSFYSELYKEKIQIPNYVVPSWRPQLWENWIIASKKSNAYTYDAWPGSNRWTETSKWSL